MGSCTSLHFFDISSFVFNIECLHHVPWPYIYIYIYIYIHTYIHTYTHTHTHTYSPFLSPSAFDLSPCRNFLSLISKLWKSYRLFRILCQKSQWTEETGDLQGVFKAWPFCQPYELCGGILGLVSGSWRVSLWILGGLVLMVVDSKHLWK